MLIAHCVSIFGTNLSQSEDWSDLLVSLEGKRASVGQGYFLKALANSFLICLFSKTEFFLTEFSKLCPAKASCIVKCFWKCKKYLSFGITLIIPIFWSLLHQRLALFEFITTFDPRKSLWKQNHVFCKFYLATMKSKFPFSHNRQRAVTTGEVTAEFTRFIQVLWCQWFLQFTKV